jgi:hypothetical protein
MSTYRLKRIFRYAQIPSKENFSVMPRFLLRHVSLDKRVILCSYLRLHVSVCDDCVLYVGSAFVINRRR